MTEYRKLSKEHKDFLKSVVKRVICNKNRISHTKAELGRCCGAAFANQYKNGGFLRVTESTVSTILKRLRVEDNILILSEPNGKGLLWCDDAILDTLWSVEKQKQKIATMLHNQATIPTLKLTLEFIPRQQASLEEAESVKATLQDGNQKLIGEVNALSQASNIKYEQRLVPVQINQ